MRLICGADHPRPSSSMVLPAIVQLELAAVEVPIKVSPMATGKLKQPELQLAAVITFTFTVIVINIAAEPEVVSAAIVPGVMPISTIEPGAMAFSED